MAYKRGQEVDLHPVTKDFIRLLDNSGINGANLVSCHIVEYDECDLDLSYRLGLKVLIGRNWRGYSFWANDTNFSLRVTNKKEGET